MLRRNAKMPKRQEICICSFNKSFLKSFTKIFFKIVNVDMFIETFQRNES